MDNIKKNKIKKRIGILSTARSITHEQLIPALQWIEKQGFEVELGQTIGIADNQFAGTIQQRIDDLQQMIDNPQIDLIWCARGGYGTVQLLDYVDFSSLKKNPKWIAGYSDVTALHSHLHTLAIPSIHSTMPVNINTNSIEALQSLFNIIIGEANEYQWTDPLNNHQQCEIKGTLVGGNLSILYSLLGSPSAIDTTGKILLLEDLDEYLYHLDRMMRNLDRNGILSGLKALIIGSFTQMHDNAIPYGKDAYHIIASIAERYDFPIIFGAPLGHIDDNRAYVLGRLATIILDGNQVIFRQKTNHE